MIFPALLWTGKSARGVFNVFPALKGNDFFCKRPTFRPEQKDTDAPFLLSLTTRDTFRAAACAELAEELLPTVRWHYRRKAAPYRAHSICRLNSTGDPIPPKRQSRLSKSVTLWCDALLSAVNSGVSARRLR